MENRHETLYVLEIPSPAIRAPTYETGRQTDGHQTDLARHRWQRSVVASVALTGALRLKRTRRAHVAAVDQCPQIVSTLIFKPPAAQTAGGWSINPDPPRS